MLSQFKQIEDNTCVRFVERTYQLDYVRIGKFGGCWARYGRLGGRQDVSMGDGCLRMATMMHEMMHAIGNFFKFDIAILSKFVMFLGIDHMHNAYDRDDYLTIFLDNVDEGNRHNFKKGDPSQFDNLNTPYDMRSVMHYARWAFSNNGQNVVVPHDSSYLEVIGNQEVLSEGDASRLNRMHLCSGHYKKA